MKILTIILKVILCLICLLPVAGATGLLPAPTPDLYNTPEAFAFIELIGHVAYINAFIFAAAIVLIIMDRMAFAALLVLPLTVNIVAFHAFLDGGLFTGGAVLGNIMLLINAYFLWLHRKRYLGLMDKDSTVSAA